MPAVSKVSERARALRGVRGKQQQQVHHRASRHEQKLQGVRVTAVLAYPGWPNRAGIWGAR